MGKKTIKTEYKCLLLKDTYSINVHVCKTILAVVCECANKCENLKESNHSAHC